jgi:hypothetical protein
VSATNPVAASDAAAIRAARGIVGSLTLGLLVLAAPSGLLAPSVTLARLVGPAALAGIVAPALAHHLHARALSRVAPDSDAGARRRAFVRAHVLSASITEAAALFGIVVHALTGQWLPMIGVVTHVLLAGALWPTAERLAAVGRAEP